MGKEAREEALRKSTERKKEKAMKWTMKRVVKQASGRRHVPRQKRWNQIVAVFLLAVMMVGMLPEGLTVVNATVADTAGGSTKGKVKTYTWRRVHTIKELPTGDEKVPVLFGYLYKGTEYFVQMGTPQDGYFTSHQEAAGWNTFKAIQADDLNGVRITSEKFVTTSADVIPAWLEFAGYAVPEVDDHDGSCYYDGILDEPEDGKLPTYHIYATETDKKKEKYGQSTDLRLNYYWTGAGQGNTYFFDSSPTAVSMEFGDANYESEVYAHGKASKKNYTNRWYARTGSTYGSLENPSDEFSFFWPITDAHDMFMNFGYGSEDNANKTRWDRVTFSTEEEWTARACFFRVFVGEEGDHMNEVNVENSSQATDEKYEWVKVEKLSDLPTTKGKAVPLLVMYNYEGVNYFLNADYRFYNGDQIQRLFTSGERVYSGSDIKPGQKSFETKSNLMPLWIECSGRKAPHGGDEYTKNADPKPSDGMLNTYHIYGSNPDGTESSYRLNAWSIRGKRDQGVEKRKYSGWGVLWEDSTAFMSIYDKGIRYWKNGCSEEWAQAQLDGQHAEGWAGYEVYRKDDASLCAEWVISNSMGNNSNGDKSDEFQIIDAYWNGYSYYELTYNLGWKWWGRKPTNIGFCHPDCGDMHDGKIGRGDKTTKFTLYIGKFTNEELGGKKEGQNEKVMPMPTELKTEDWYEWTKATNLTDFAQGLPDENDVSMGYVPILMTFQREEESNNKKETKTYVVDGRYSKFYADEEKNDTYSGFQIYEASTNGQLLLDQDTFVTQGSMNPLWIKWAKAEKPARNYYTLRTEANGAFGSNPNMKNKLNKYYIHGSDDNGLPSTYRLDYIARDNHDSYMMQADKTKDAINGMKVRTNLAKEWNSILRYGSFLHNTWFLTTRSTEIGGTSAEKFYFFNSRTDNNENFSFNHEMLNNSNLKYYTKNGPSWNDDKDGEQNDWMRKNQFFTIYIGKRIKAQETFKEDETITQAYTEYDGTRTIPEGVTLTISKGCTLVVSGILANNGTIYNNGGLLVVKDGGKIISTNWDKIYAAKGENKDFGNVRLANSVYRADSGGDLIINEGGKVFIGNGMEIDGCNIINNGLLAMMAYGDYKKEELQSYLSKYEEKNKQYPNDRTYKAYLDNYKKDYKELYGTISRSSYVYMLCTKNSTYENNGIIYMGYAPTKTAKLVSLNDWSNVLGKMYQNGSTAYLSKTKLVIDPDNKTDNNAFFSSINSKFIKSGTTAIEFKEGYY